MLNCPKCLYELREIDYEGTIIHTCDECGGELISSAAIQHIISERQADLADQPSPAQPVWQPTYGIPDTEFEKVYMCPLCEQAMNVINYSGDTGVHIDRCDTCHVLFLEHEELEKIQLIIEQFERESSAQLGSIAIDLEKTRWETAQTTGNRFAGSRFAFVNAVINRFLDAA